MKKNCLFIFITVLLVNKITGMDGIEFLRTNQWIDVVSITPTNLTLKPISDKFFIANDDIIKKNQELRKKNPIISLHSRCSSEYIENNELLILTPDQVTTLTEGRHIFMYFTPVSYKNKYKGFQITKKYAGGPYYEIKPITTYIALSDTPMELGADDVEMIWKDGKFRTLDECRVIDERGKEKKEADEKFDARFRKAINEQGETEVERLVFFNKLNAMESREAIIAYLDELENPPDELSTTNTVHKIPDVSKASPPANRAWLWWFAFPVVAGVWFALRKK